MNILNGYWYHGYKYNNRKHKNFLNVTYISFYLPQIYSCLTCFCNSPQSHFLQLFFMPSLGGIVSHKVYFPL